MCLPQAEEVEGAEHKKQHQENWCCRAEAPLLEKDLAGGQAGRPAGAEGGECAQELRQEQLPPHALFALQGSVEKGLLHIHGSRYPFLNNVLLHP